MAGSCHLRLAGCQGHRRQGLALRRRRHRRRRRHSRLRAAGLHGRHHGRRAPGSEVVPRGSPKGRESDGIPRRHPGRGSAAFTPRSWPRPSAFGLSATRRERLRDGDRTRRCPDEARLFDALDEIDPRTRVASCPSCGTSSRAAAPGASCPLGVQGDAGRCRAGAAQRHRHRVVSGPRNERLSKK